MREHSRRRRGSAIVDTTPVLCHEGRVMPVRIRPAVGLLEQNERINLMDRNDACVVLDLIECATDCNWPEIKEGLKEMGYNGSEVESAVGALAEIARRTNPIYASDF